MDREIAEFLNRPGAVERFSAQTNKPTIRSAEVSALVAQAEAYARLLDPPVPVGKVRGDEAAGARDAATVVPLAPTPSLRFRLCATSYYPNEPKRSMALISELGSPEGDERWIKEGTQVGHFVIHEIRKGMIVYRDGDQLREMAVEHGASVPSIVRDARPGSRQVSRVGDDAATTLSARGGLKIVESLGGN